MGFKKGVSFQITQDKIPEAKKTSGLTMFPSKKHIEGGCHG